MNLIDTSNDVLQINIQRFIPSYSHAVKPGIDGPHYPYTSAGKGLRDFDFNFILSEAI